MSNPARQSGQRKRHGKASRRASVQGLRFKKGDVVQVRPGTPDPDFPDFPLGGWTGVIAQAKAETPPLYCIKWNDRTLRSVHPVYRHRCDHDGLEVDEMWLMERDLEPAADPPAPIEQPTEITPRPLDLGDAEDRIRSLFGLTSDEPLPPVNQQSLAAFHAHLARQPVFPFAAEWRAPARGFQRVLHQVTVLAIADLPDCALEHGIFCKIQSENRTLLVPLAGIELSGRARLLPIGDYVYWFQCQL